MATPLLDEQPAKSTSFVYETLVPLIRRCVTPAAGYRSRPRCREGTPGRKGLLAVERLLDLLDLQHPSKGDDLRVGNEKIIWRITHIPRESSKQLSLPIRHLRARVFHDHLSR